jgi:DNA-binding PadR family transcriptional regulator
MKALTLFEQIVLASIVILKDDAFGVAIRKKARQISGKSIMYGALYNVLDQLHRKGFVTKTKKTPSPLEGGHTRIYYTVTQEGLSALQQAYTLQKNIWTNLPDLTEGL